ncbi:MAG: HAMP domain-containing sensor histidine kinase [Chloroflexota bacterium]
MNPATSLRARLIAAFAAVILLTLVLVGSGVVFILRGYQEDREQTRLGVLANQVTFTLRQSESAGASRAELFDLLARRAEELDVRVVLMNPGGVIIFDSENQLVGQRVDLPGAQRIGPIRRALLADPDQRNRRLAFISTLVGPGQAAISRAGPFVLAFASEPPTFGSVLREMFTRLALAGLVSALVAIWLAWLLAGSIARRLGHLTRAAERMAAGHFEHELPDLGQDEVGRLAGAFTAMTREVGRANRALRDIVANVSHDLRTPLTSIQGFSQAMLDGTLSTRDDYNQAARIVHDEASSMARMVEDLLELSQIEAGHVSLELAPGDLAAIVGQSVDRHQVAATDRGVELVYVASVHPTVRQDPRRIHRVFDNLIGNAVKFSPAGGRVIVRVEESPREREAVVTVHNDGPPIPEQDLPRIFDRFYRGDKSRSSGRGSGLGLAIAREITQAHRGHIEVTSSQLDGTTFRIGLPLLDRSRTPGLVSDPDGRREPAVRQLPIS